MNTLRKLGLSLLASALLWPSVAAAWTLSIDGAASGIDEALDVAVDASGDLLAVGRLDNGVVATDLIVVKVHGAFGTEIWRKEIDGAASGDDEGVAVAVDGGGDVIVTGVLEAAFVGGDFSVIKFDGATGAELWRTVINGTAFGLDRAQNVAIDGSDDVLVGGFIDGAPTDKDFSIVKLDSATGAELWRQEIDGTNSDGDEVLSLALDGAGDVFAGGYLVNSGTDADLTVLKFSGATGAELWRQEIDGVFTGFDQVNAIAVDGSGDVVAGGVIQKPALGTAEDFIVVKFDGTTGTELWRNEIDSVTEVFDQAFSVAVDGADDVIAAGTLSSTATALDADLAVVKLAKATGAELWRTVIAGSAATDDVARDVQVDGAGDIVVSGGIVDATTGSDLSLVKLANATGAEIWRATVDGSAVATDDALDVAIDSFGSVIAVGFVENIGTSRDFVVVKRNGTDGADFVPPVCGDTVTEPGEDCDDGNTTGGDCCSATCAFESAGSSCASDGVSCTVDGCDGAGTCDHMPDDGACDDSNVCTDDVCDAVLGCQITNNTDPCEDGDVCTAGDICSGGACQGGGPVTCDACEACDAGSGCVPTPQTFPVCHVPTSPLRSQLLIKDGSPDTKDLVKWRWIKGEETLAAAFGDPTATTGYDLCIFDESGPSTSLLLRATAPAASFCAGKPCWKGLGNPIGSSGYKYVDKTASADGLQKMKLKPGTAGKASISLKGKGVGLVLPGENAHAPLPLPGPVAVRVQLQGNGECWEASYSSAGVLRNDSSQFKARDD